MCEQNQNFSQCFIIVIFFSFSLLFTNKIQFEQKKKKLYVPFIENIRKKKKKWLTIKMGLFVCVHVTNDRTSFFSSFQNEMREREREKTKLTHKITRRVTIQLNCSLLNKTRERERHSTSQFCVLSFKINRASSSFPYSPISIIYYCHTVRKFQWLMKLFMLHVVCSRCSSKTNVLESKNFCACACVCV